MLLRSLTADAGLACAAAAAVFGTTLLLHPSASVVPVAVLSAGAALPVPARREWPLTAAICSAVVGLVGIAIPGWTGHFIAMALFCSAAYYRPRPWLLGGVAVGWLVLCGTSVGAAAAPLMIVDTFLIGTAPVAAGYALRVRHEHMLQAARLDRAVAATQVAQERATLAREVHDAVGHHLTAIRLQASAARYVVTDPEPVTDRALGTITDLAGAALGEVRGLLDALGPGDGAGLIELDAMAAQLDTPLCAVRVERSGRLTDLPPPAEHGAFRIVQEALTNAVRHSGASRIDVRVARDGDVLRVRVADNGRRRGAVVAGRGIAGMRERARQLGGTLAITRARGWRVEAALPLESA